MSCSNLRGSGVWSVRLVSYSFAASWRRETSASIPQNKKKVGHLRIGEGIKRSSSCTYIYSNAQAWGVWSAVQPVEPLLPPGFFPESNVRGPLYPVKPFFRPGDLYMPVLAG